MKASKKPAAKAAPRGLGKGLSALMSESYSQAANETQWAQEGAATELSLPINKIQPGKYQPRREFSSEGLAELADSIKKNGVLQPILVRALEKGNYEIIAGERRWRASKMAGLEIMPVVIRSINDDQALEFAIIENVQRQDLNPLEEAAGYQRLMDDFGYTQEALSAVVHKSRSHIANLLRLLSLPEEIRFLMGESKLTAGHARALMGVENAVNFAHEIIRRGLNVRQTEKLVRAGKNLDIERKPRRTKADAAPIAPAAPSTVVEFPPRRQGPKDPDIIALEETLSENLGLKVSIDDRGQSGEITVAYESLEQLDEVLRRLGGSI